MSQGLLFGDLVPAREGWRLHWRGMPDFIQEDLSAKDHIEYPFKDGPLYVNFAEVTDRVAFEKRVTEALREHPGKKPEDLGRAWLSKVVEQDLEAGKDAADRKRTQSVWWPEAEIGRFAGKAYVTRAALRPGDRVARTPTEAPVPYERADFLPPPSSETTIPRFPVYVISKGRWETRYTAKALEEIGVPYRIVVEPQEADAYRAVIDPAKVLVLPFSNLGQGSIPARNWVWAHSIEEGAPWHWIMDDNIQGFYRLHRNLKTPVADGTIFRAAEDFSLRYENVAQFGLHYFMFASRKSALPPYYLNSRVYSCMCIRNDVLPEGSRWRGRYNEDTDLSLRILKDGHVTVLFSAFLAFKSTTMTMKGGNTDSLYAGTEATFAVWEEHAKSCGTCGGGRPWLCAEARRILEPDGRWRMALSLYEQHPTRTEIARKWGRWQHSVLYDFTQKLIPRAGAVPPEGVDDYGMVLRVRDQGASTPHGQEVPVDAHKVIRVHFEKEAEQDRDQEEPRPVAKVVPAATVEACGHAWHARLCPTCTPAPLKRAPQKQATILTAEVIARPVPPGWTPDLPPALRSRGVKRISLDYETTGLQWWRPEVRPVGCGVAWEEDGKVQTRYLAWGHRGGNGMTEESARAWMKDEVAGLEVVNLNTVFDGHISQEWGVDWDALGCRLKDVAHYAALLDDHRASGWRRSEKPFSLQALGLDYVGEGKGGEDLDKSRMADYHAHEVTPYGRQDVSLALRILRAQEAQLQAQGLMDVVALEDSIIPVVIEMERNAARIDVEKLTRWTKQSAEELDTLRFKLARDVGWNVNPDSPDHMARLFRELGLQSDQVTETGQESFAADVLAKHSGNAVIARVIKVARLSDLRSKFLVPYSQAVGADGLLRFSFHQLKGDQYGTVSGRFSATKPTGATKGANPQQVFSVENQLRMHCVACASDPEWGKRKDKLPRHYAEHGEAYLIRELFIPDEGADLVASDAKQIEYRTFAHLSRAPRLLQAYRDNPDTDFHEWTGDLVRSHRPDFDRKKLKIFNFMLLFGAGSEATADMMGISKEEGKELRDVYFKVFPEAPELMNLAMDVAFTPGRFRRRKVNGDWITASAEGRGYVKTIAGRRARFPEAKRLHAALNRAVSGSAADLNKMKLRTLYRERKALGLKLRLTVHDEVVADLLKGQLDAFKRVMDIQETPLLVPILWDTKIAKNWAEAK